ncbi:hypothetical protein PM082_010316 [Marasmius tenuissimus]|nr:hypothetical protein PM082_010316 [Marasmius tenuissimus]
MDPALSRAFKALYRYHKQEQRRKDAAFTIGPLSSSAYISPSYSLTTRGFYIPQIGQMVVPPSTLGFDWESGAAGSRHISIAIEPRCTSPNPQNVEGSASAAEDYSSLERQL